VKELSTSGAQGDLAKPPSTEEAAYMKDLGSDAVRGEKGYTTDGAQPASGPPWT
jgi:hypothetical protein